MREYARLWRELIGLCGRRYPGATAFLIGWHVASTVMFAAVGLTLRALVEATQAGTATAIGLAALGAALVLTVNLGVEHIAYLRTIHLVERISLTEVEPRILRACAELPQVRHLEEPEFLDRVTTLRGQSGAVVDWAWAVLQAVAATIGLLVALAVLGGVNPWLLALLPCAAVQLAMERHGRKKIAEEDLKSAEDLRLHRDLYDEVCVNPAALKELRVYGAAAHALKLQAEAWERVTRSRARAALIAAGWSSAGWLVFGAGFTLAIFLVTAAGHPGDIILAVSMGVQFRNVVEHALHRSMQVGGYRRLLRPYLWLMEYARTHRDTADVASPVRLRRGIELRNVSFTYPGTTRPVLEDLSVHLPAGAVVAVVGEYGSGKTTLVKLLAKMYAPDSGSILVDDVELSALDTAGWRASMSAAFQDFGRYCTTFEDSVLMGARGDLHATVRDADAEALVSRLPDGPATELGRRFGGIELSEGQWQKVALARSGARARPLLFVLDEPTASLDAPSEHAIFSRYARRSRELAALNGAISVIVSHRFSTVAHADLILVMAAGKLVESGRHDELLTRNGMYADLYGIHAAAHA
ncbi:ATP-binding cassette domain-containing protein [Nonomuraea angiospora]|uniref:ATP-binding cassette domain-containing protein n=1 Tax=Nonomuraea angiospora TaxID=46172 RepID=UPI00379A8042